MDRRTYLRTAGVGGLAAAAGCLDGLFESRADGAVLSPPDQSRGEPTHPTYGDPVPSFSVEDPFAEATVSDADFEGERAYLMTFVFSECPTGDCPAMLNLLWAAREDAAQEGYGDDAAFLAITFDPETDTRETLQEEADLVGIDPDADNWHFLRPETNDEAYEVVAEDFGVPVHLEDDHHEHHGPDGDDDHAADGDDDHEANGDEQDGIDGDAHTYMILLVNQNGVVERSYPRSMGHDAQEIIDDLRTVVEG